MELLRPLADAEFPASSVASGAAAATVGTWNPGPQGVMVWSTEPVYVSVGEGVTATSASTPIPAFTPIPFYAPQTGTGAPWRVSVLRVAVDGVVYAKPINIR
jgi:hypothetical protein